MSPGEIKLLQHVGQAFVSNISELVTQSILYGLYLSIFTFGIRALLRRNPWTKYTWILFGLLSVLFTIVTVNLAIFLSLTIGLIRGALINNPDQPLLVRFQTADKSVGRLDVAGIWFGAGSGGSFLFVAADAVVVWRACVLWPGNKIAKFLPLALLFASFGSAIASATLDTLSFLGSPVLPASSPTGIMITLTLSLSLATNVVATILIGYKAYYHMKMMKTSIGMQSSRSGAILSFLTESGIAFCVLQVIGLATDVPDNTSLSTLDYAARTWQDILTFAAAAYPVLILIIVDSHRSISDHTAGSVCDSGVAQASKAGGLGIESHLSFAASPLGISSSNTKANGAESMTGSRIGPTAGADYSKETEKEGIYLVQDVEKGEGVISLQKETR